jgi:hypothetical protein
MSNGITWQSSAAPSATRGSGIPASLHLTYRSLQASRSCSDSA